ncbi:beta-N-acetylhexosaminidase [Streptomyces fulvorobeus]|uniref:beta-N-acetylhexosaminidase n=1 Tax=Streptomyces fulvorobeus TaxID=284028 RepID=A0A7J0BZ79_9ACTN|nr:beta-N-acetylhexosaminidase [Streptomyces fulvorobeus]NYE39352.1 hexosaminidase [Streptomyces fulvorobeus]GFM95570.1 beta-hexosaminidase [Streptomyces fulvorobeus]
MPALRPDFHLVPRPTKLTPRPGHFTLDGDTAVRATPGAEAAAGLLRTLLAPATGLPLPESPTGQFVLALDPQLGGLGTEGYGLTIDPHAVRLRAAHLTGLLRGIQTVRQLLPAAALPAHPSPGRAWQLPCAEITDVPRHSWRGVMLDVARHFQPVSFLRRYVDLLALHKLNVLHLHLTDDQGWRMPVAAYPKLTEIGGHRARSMTGAAGSEAYDGRPHGGSYTRAELVGLVAYAAARGVTVVPEIEMPGHARAAIAAYPELGDDPGRRLDVWTRWGVCDTVLGVHDDRVLDFCRTVLEEVMDVFDSPYIHVGGDECPTTEWERSPAARARVAAEGLAGPGALHGWFMARIGAFLAGHGRTPAGWAETGTELPPEFTVMSWRDPAHALDAARRGNDVVTAHYLSTYLDYAQSEFPGEPPAQPGAIVDLRAVHAHEPVPTGWEPAAAARVLGAQAQLWTEFATTPDHIEYLTYPRVCALADRTWSGAEDWEDFTVRLRSHTARLDALGVNYRPLSPRPLTAAAARTAPPRRSTPTVPGRNTH